MTGAEANLLVDVTQYVSAPATSGVQRVLRHLARDWPGRTIEARYGFIEDRHYAMGPLSELGSVIASTFRATSGTHASGIEARAETVRDALRETADRIIPSDHVEGSFDAYLLPEPTLNAEILAVAMRLQDSPQTTPFFLYYDALPLTHPQFFRARDVDQAGFTKYHRSVVRSDNVAFISQAVRALFEKRIARGTPSNAIVARPGADGLPPVRQLRSPSATFTIVGTVEPRKQHRVVLDAFEQLWASGRDYQLVVLGAPGGAQPGVLERLRTLSRTSRVEWIERARDEDICNALSRSSAMVFVSDGEGYGLPPLEALAVGCPVIVAEDLPALEGLASAGQIRLRTINAQTVAAAIDLLADPAANAAHRRAIDDLSLPTWEQFASDLEHWITIVLDSRDSKPSRVTG